MLARFISRAPYFSAALALLSVFLLASGCECSPPRDGRACATQRDCRSTETCLDGRCSPRVDGSLPPGVDGGPGTDAGPPRMIESLRIEPATSELVSIDGARPMESFRAILVYSDGTEGAAIGPSFTIDTVSLGDLDEASGVFSANGTIGGSATISVSVPGPGGAPLAATATLVVRLERTLRGAGLTDDDVARFGA
ncbi:MAG: hypothetical protein M3Y87_20815, partial [Myxococcota bacterium]|nr:hypothetical protein [Myxococcota bacterium]